MSACWCFGHGSSSPVAYGRRHATEEGLPLLNSRETGGDMGCCHGRLDSFWSRPQLAMAQASFFCCFPPYSASPRCIMPHHHLTAFLPLGVCPFRIKHHYDAAQHVFPQRHIHGTLPWTRGKAGWVVASSSWLQPSFFPALWLDRPPWS